MRRLRLFLSVVVVVAASVGVSGAASPSGLARSRWVVSDLGSSSWPVAINDRGQVVGWDFFFSKGKMTKLGTLGGWRVTAAAVNERGQVIGASVTGKDAALPLKPHAFVWQHGTMIDLTPAAHPDARAFAVNGRCQIVGYEATSKRDENGHLVKAFTL